MLSFALWIINFPFVKSEKLSFENEKKNHNEKKIN